MIMKSAKVRVIFGLLLAISILALTTHAANSSSSTTAPPIEWSKTYGGTGNDVAVSIIQTSDGGYAFAATTGSYSSTDACLFKISSTGNLQWNKTYHQSGSPGASSNQSIPYALIQTGDGGYALAGYTTFPTSNTSLVFAWLVKTDSVGNLQWNKTYRGSGDASVFSMIQTNDDGYALVGSTRTLSERANAQLGEVYLFKTDSTGNLQWNMTYGGGTMFLAFSVIQTSDAGYTLGGPLVPGGSWLLKTDSAGNQIWNKTYLGIQAYSVILASDGGYALAGPNAGYLYLIKTDSVGNQQWNQTYPDITNSNYKETLVQTSDGGYAVSDETAANNHDGILIKTDSTGNPQWNITYGGTGQVPDAINSMTSTSDGGYTLAGYTQSSYPRSFAEGNGNIWVFKVAGTGVIPEFPSSVSFSILVGFTGLSVVLVKKKHAFKPVKLYSKSQ